MIITTLFGPSTPQKINKQYRNTAVMETSHSEFAKIYFRKNEMIFKYFSSCTFACLLSTDAVPGK